MFFLKTTLSSVLTLFVTVCACAQEKIPNIPEYDKQRFHFGLALGFTLAYFKAERNSDIVDSVYYMGLKSQPGYLVGIVCNRRVGDSFDVRFVPTLSFVQRKLIYRITRANESSAIKTESTFLEFPLLLKYKFRRASNYRFYAEGGGKYSIDLQSRMTSSYLIQLKPHDYGYEIGLGADCYLRYFKFALEVKTYYGINNVLVKDNLIYSRALESLKSGIVYVSFLFE